MKSIIITLLSISMLTLASCAHRMSGSGDCGKDKQCADCSSEKKCEGKEGSCKMEEPKSEVKK